MCSFSMYSYNTICRQRCTSCSCGIDILDRARRQMIERITWEHPYEVKLQFGYILYNKYMVSD